MLKLDVIIACLAWRNPPEYLKLAHLISSISIVIILHLINSRGLLSLKLGGEAMVYE